MPTVVITGGASGLGLVTGRYFAEAGYEVMTCDVSPAAVERARKQTFIRYADIVDMGQRQDVERFLSVVLERTHAVDVLVNNVGIAGPRDAVADIPIEGWNQTMAANLNGALWCLQRVLPGMCARRSGVVLNVSSCSVAHRPEKRAAYVVSKAALEALSACVAREYGPFGIRSNCVRPGLLDNERARRVLQHVADTTGRTLADVEGEQLAFTSLRAKIDMDDVAQLLVYLASPAAARLTGQVIGLDAGMQWEG
jgi:NAD(P)-dependent dehydrogenase (short-subunit alcohol dehydrogenase family)